MWEKLSFCEAFNSVIFVEGLYKIRYAYYLIGGNTVENMPFAYTEMTWQFTRQIRCVLLSR